jgi:hypothetical protein
MEHLCSTKHVTVKERGKIYRTCHRRHTTGVDQVQGFRLTQHCFKTVLRWTETLNLT